MATSIFFGLFFILFVVAFLLGCCLSESDRLNKSLKQEAVDRGYAKFNVSDGETLEFDWLKEPEQKDFEELVISLNEAEREGVEKEIGDLIMEADSLGTASALNKLSRGITGKDNEVFQRVHEQE